MLNNNDLNYNIGDIVLVDGYLYDVISHIECNQCPFNILNICYGKPVFKNRKTNVEAKVCPIAFKRDNSDLRRLYQVVTSANIRW